MRLFWHDFNSPRWASLVKGEDPPAIGERVVLRDLMGGEFEVSAIVREVVLGADEWSEEIGTREVWWVGFDPDPDHPQYHYLDPPWPKD